MTGIFLWRRSVHRTRHGDSPISAIISISHGTGSYIGELIFNMLILVGAVKMADRLVKEMIGI